MAYKTAFYALGTENSIAVENESSAAAISEIIERVEAIEEKMSTFRSTSEVSLIAQKAGKAPVKVSDEVYHVIETALEISNASDGAFDITVRPLTELWAFSGGNNEIPEKRRIVFAKNRVSYKFIKLDPKEKTVFLTKKGCSIDLGGIAKGYAADEAKRILLEHGIDNAIVNFGGNIVALGNSFDGSPCKIGVQNPLSVRGESVMTFDAADKTIVTSAVNEQFFIEDGVRYHHIISPLTGYPAQSGVLSVTVIDECSMRADALTTAAFVLGLWNGVRFLRKFGVNAVFITQDGDVFSTFETNRKTN